MNDDLKAIFKDRHIPQWKVAAFLGINESSFCRLLRKEVDLETKLKIYEAVDALSKEDKVCGFTNC